MISWKYELSKVDIFNWLRMVLIIYSPVLLMFFDQIEKNVFDFKILYVLWVSITIDLIRRYIKDYKESVIKSIDKTDITEIAEYFNIQEKK